MEKFKSHKRSGLTIIELLVAIAIFSVILGAIYSLFGFGNKMFSNGVKQYDIQSSSRLAVDYITQQLRYAEKIEVKDEGFIVPQQNIIDPYENYIYIEEESIVHVNKYFKRTYQVGKGGSIGFVSNNPFNNLSFTINAYSYNQKYQVKGEIFPLNLHLGSGIIEGAVSEGDHNKKSGKIIWFKTASDYLAEKLRPVATIGSINSETKLIINYDRDIIDSEIISYHNLTEPDVNYSRKAVTLTTRESLAGGEVIIRVTFGGMDSEGNTYDYIAVYDSDRKIWTLE